MIPDGFDHQIVAILDLFDKTGGMNVGASDKGDVGHVVSGN
jgi:hypothetical protein